MAVIGRATHAGPRDWGGGHPSRAHPGNPIEDASEQLAGHRHLRHLEDQVAVVGDNVRPDLHQLAQGGQRPPVDLHRQGQGAEEVGDALGVLSFAAARPRGVSGMHFEEHEQWTAADLLRHLRYERGRLVCETNYVRGRMMKTDVTVFPDGRFTLTTTNRGEAASRWAAQIQGKKVLRPVPPTGEDEPGE